MWCAILLSQDDTGSLSSDSEDLELGGDPSMEAALEGAGEEDEQFGSDDNF